MNFQPLKNVLLQTIDGYLNDNPEPKSMDGLIDSIKAIFKEEGRKRAHRYKLLLEQYSDSDSLLAINVLNDIKNRGADSQLETSSDLRKRLLDCLCDYFEISDQAITSAQLGYVGPGFFAQCASLYQLESRVQWLMIDALREKILGFINNREMQFIEEDFAPSALGLSP